MTCSPRPDCVTPAVSPRRNSVVRARPVWWRSDGLPGRALFSSDRTDGVSVAAEKLSGEIQEHGYWGGVRDRIPLAQTDRLDPSGELSLETDPVNWAGHCPAAQQPVPHPFRPGLD
ncbi:MAG: phenylacetaldoxime dehydratase family protein [Pseudonocardiales bacterium]|nr:phenylacetaldoxime dehydratase family protein [Pseudonocardiales bacterium]